MESLGPLLGLVFGKVKRALKSFHGWLNTLGSILLLYALNNPTAASELLGLLPPEFRTPFALATPALWFLLVSYAKARALKKAQQAPKA